MKYSTSVLGHGIYVPEKILTNHDLESMVETSHQWIIERTGISSRRISNPAKKEFPTDMAYFAAQDALKMAGLTPNDIELIIFATTTPDYKLPNSASLLQTKLGITNKCACFDLSAACSGFVYAMHISNAFIKTNTYKHILIIGSEMLSREVNWKDRATCILFGDGCGAFVLGNNSNHPSSEVMSSVIGADGEGQHFFYQHLGGAVHPLNPENVVLNERYMQMNGKEMFKVAVRTLAENSVKVLKMANLDISDIDWFIPHQANLRIIEATANRLNFPMDKIIINIEKYANTSAATIPLAFYDGFNSGKIKRGDKILLSAFGAGLTSGALIFTY